MLNTSKIPPIKGAVRFCSPTYVFDFYLNTSIIYFLPVVNPPLAPPNAFPNVLVTISISYITPNFSGVPFPLSPITPVP